MPWVLAHVTRRSAPQPSRHRPTAAAVGLVEQGQFHSATIHVAQGDLLLLYTDGVTEARNLRGEEFRPQGLIDFMQQYSQLPATDLLRELRRTLQEFAGGQPLADDTTIVVGKLTA